MFTILFYLLSFICVLNISFERISPNTCANAQMPRNSQGQQASAKNLRWFPKVLNSQQTSSRNLTVSNLENIPNKRKNIIQKVFVVEGPRSKKFKTLLSHTIYQVRILKEMRSETRIQIWIIFSNGLTCWFRSIVPRKTPLFSFENNHSNDLGNCSILQRAPHINAYRDFAYSFITPSYGCFTLRVYFGFPLNQDHNKENWIENVAIEDFEEKFCIMSAELSEYLSRNMKNENRDDELCPIIHLKDNIINKKLRNGKSEHDSKFKLTTSNATKIPRNKEKKMEFGKQEPKIFIVEQKLDDINSAHSHNKYQNFGSTVSNQEHETNFMMKSVVQNPIHISHKTDITIPDKITKISNVLNLTTAVKNRRKEMEVNESDESSSEESSENIVEQGSQESNNEKEGEEKEEEGEEDGIIHDKETKSEILEVKKQGYKYSTNKEYTFHEKQGAQFYERKKKFLIEDTNMKNMTHSTNDIERQPVHDHKPGELKLKPNEDIKQILMEIYKWMKQQKQSQPLYKTSEESIKDIANKKSEVNNTDKIKYIDVNEKPINSHQKGQRLNFDSNHVNKFSRINQNKVIIQSLNSYLKNSSENFKNHSKTDSKNALFNLDYKNYGDGNMSSQTDTKEKEIYKVKRRTPLFNNNVRKGILSETMNKSGNILFLNQLKSSDRSLKTLNTKDKSSEQSLKTLNTKDKIKNQDNIEKKNTINNTIISAPFLSEDEYHDELKRVFNENQIEKVISEDYLMIDGFDDSKLNIFDDHTIMKDSGISKNSTDIYRYTKDLTGSKNNFSNANTTDESQLKNNTVIITNQNENSKLRLSNEGHLSNSGNFLLKTQLNDTLESTNFPIYYTSSESPTAINNNNNNSFLIWNLKNIEKELGNSSYDNSTENFYFTFLEKEEYDTPMKFSPGNKSYIPLSSIFPNNETSLKSHDNLSLNYYDQNTSHDDYNSLNGPNRTFSTDLYLSEANNSSKAHNIKKIEKIISFYDQNITTVNSKNNITRNTRSSIASDMLLKNKGRKKSKSSAEKSDRVMRICCRRAVRYTHKIIRRQVGANESDVMCNKKNKFLEKKMLKYEPDLQASCLAMFTKCCASWYKYLKNGTAISREAIS